jgi:hypothetical protein
MTMNLSADQTHFRPDLDGSASMHTACTVCGGRLIIVDGALHGPLLVPSKCPRGHRTTTVVKLTHSSNYFFSRHLVMQCKVLIWS